MIQTPIDPTQLSLQELEKAQLEFAEQIRQRKAQQKRQTLESIMTLIQDAGLDPREIADFLNARSRRKKAPAMYRNPQNARQTWSGHGQPPLWFVEAPDKEKLRIPRESRK